MSISTHMNIYIYMHAQINIGINFVYRVYFAIKDFVTRFRNDFLNKCGFNNHQVINAESIPGRLDFVSSFVFNLISYLIVETSINGTDSKLTPSQWEPLLQSNAVSIGWSQA